MIVILGPTACGKTKLATQLAFDLGGDVVSADSRQVYSGMDIGTGKDLGEYVIDNQSIKYHLIDIVAAGEQYNLHRFQQDFYEIISQITGSNRLPIVCGGSGLYLASVLNDYRFAGVPISENVRQEFEKLSDEDLKKRFESRASAYTTLADTSTRKRLIRAIEISEYLIKNPDKIPAPAPKLPPTLIFGLDLPTEIRRERITKRLKERLANGMIDEVERLLSQNISPEQLIFYGLEYKFVTQYLQQQMSYETMFEQLNIAIHQFAKRQMTFFRKMERDGIKINWLDATQPTKILVEEIKIAIKNIDLLDNQIHTKI
jgi:tRNA dimethylallyltransferase